jgi:tetratricopeptide (TPR) repeat protein
VSPSINKQRAARLFDQARLHLERQEPQKAEPILADLLANSALRDPLIPAALAESLIQQKKWDEALVTLRAGLKEFPAAAELTVRLASTLVQRGDVDEGLGLLARSDAKLRQSPVLLGQYAFALLQAGRIDQAHAVLTRALERGASPDARLLFAAVRAKQGAFEEAESLAAKLEASAPPSRVDAIQALRADCRLFLGDAEGALALYQGLRSRGKLGPEQLGHMAYAAQLAQDTAQVEGLIQEREAHGATPEDHLLFAQIANLQGNPERALERLEAAAGAKGPRFDGFDFEAGATKGRALRLLGRREEARAILERLADAPEAGTGRLGPKVFVDLGHLDAESGDFEAAARGFDRALALDPSDPEAKHGQALTRKRVAWRSALEASAEEKVEAARAEAEALQRRFSAREGELEKLRRELEAVRAAQRESEEKARRAEEEAKVAAERAREEQKKKLTEELAQREAEIDAKARENLQRAFGEAVARCPPAILTGVLVAEQTFQRALYTDLPAAAVAVLFAGALERTLYALFVERFRGWLRETGQLASFLQGAVRERRGTRVEYFDHFIEAFDEERPGRAPSMGEVARVIERRNEPYLAPFRAFLQQTYGLDEGFLDELGAFVLWAKTKLRDPVAHGRGIELGYDELKVLREKMLFTLGGRGLFATLLAGAGNKA